MKFTYDQNNIFYSIIHKKISTKVVLENEHALCFHDIHPRSKIHLLVIPKGEYVNALHFLSEATAAEAQAFTQLVSEVCEKFHVKNFTLETNGGANADVGHFHLHILSA